MAKIEIVITTASGQEVRLTPAEAHDLILQLKQAMEGEPEVYRFGWPANPYPPTGPTYPHYPMVTFTPTFKSPGSTGTPLRVTCEQVCV